MLGVMPAGRGSTLGEMLNEWGTDVRITAPAPEQSCRRRH